MTMQAIDTLPAVELECGGALLDWQEVAALDGIYISQQLGLPAQCELTFRDPPGPLTIEQRLPVGEAFRVLLKGNRQPIFSGQVTAVEQVYSAQQERVLRVRGYDRLHTLRKRQTVRAHVQVSLQDLAAQMVGDLGITVNAEGDTPTWPYLIQGHESDFDLLTRLSERCGLYLSLREDTLHLLSLDGMGAPLPLKWRENLHALTVERNTDGEAEAISATGWNTASIEVHRRQASTERVRTMSFNGVSVRDVGGHEERFIVDANAPDIRHIEALAQSALDRRRGSSLTLTGTAAGDPALRPGAIVQIDGVDPAYCGEYAVTQCRHTLNWRYGYITEFSTAPPENAAVQQGSRSAIVTYGVVVAIDDPEGIGRVRVSLPTFNDVETDWMGVLCPGAGENKGLMTLPDVNDQVLLLLADGDPARGIVLGGLYGTTGMPDDGIDEGEVRRYTFLTRGGQRICLDDSGTIMKLENSDGSYLELAPGGVTLRANTDLTITAAGHGVTIEGSTVDFVHR